MNIIKHSAIVGVMTMISRFFGFLRDTLVAAHLGGGALNDVFIVAMRLPNLFRSLFGEGAFNVSFTPMFSAEMKGCNGSLLKARAFAENVQSVLCLTVTLFALLLFLLMPYVLEILAPGLIRSEHAQICIKACKITLLYLPFISIAVFYGGILNSLKKFYAFAAIPIIYNISLMIFAVIAKGDVIYMSYAMPIAGILEVAMIILIARHNGFALKLGWPKIDKKAKELLTRVCHASIGSSVSQLSMWVDTAIASIIPGAISYLYFADRIAQLPLAIIGTAMSTVLLPTLGEHASKAELHKVSAAQLHALKTCLLFAIPAAFGINATAYTIVDALFGYGSFTSHDVYMTVLALKIIAFTIPIYVSIKILLCGIYAIGDTKTATKISVICVCLNAFISIILINFVGHISIAIASLCSATLNLYSVVRISKQRNLVKFTSKDLLRYALYIFCAATMHVCLIHLIAPALTAFSLNSIELTAIYCTCGAVIYFGLLWTIKALYTKFCI